MSPREYAMSLSVRDLWDIIEAEPHDLRTLAGLDRAIDAAAVILKRDERMLPHAQDVSGAGGGRG